MDDGLAGGSNVRPYSGSDGRPRQVVAWIALGSRVDELGVVRGFCDYGMRVTARGRWSEAVVSTTVASKGGSQPFATKM